MEKKPPLVMTPFDESLTNDFLQFVKIVLPYLPFPLQRMAGIYVKMTEFMNAFYCFQPPYYHNRRGRLRPQEKDPSSMFDEIAPYLSPEKREMFDSFSQAFQMMDMMKNMDMENFMSAQDMEEMMHAFSAERTKPNERMDGASGYEESGSDQAGTDPDSSCESRG